MTTMKKSSMRKPIKIVNEKALAPTAIWKKEFV